MVKDYFLFAGGNLIWSRCHLPRSHFLIFKFDIKLWCIISSITKAHNSLVQRLLLPQNSLVHLEHLFFCTIKCFYYSDKELQSLILFYDLSSSCLIRIVHGMKLYHPGHLQKQRRGALTDASNQGIINDNFLARKGVNEWQMRKGCYWVWNCTKAGQF